MWQDKIIFVCQAGAVIALWPIIFGKDKPSVTTSFMNFVFAGTISITLATLHFWYSMTTAGLISLSWLVIGVQKTKLKTGGAK